MPEVRKIVLENKTAEERIKKEVEDIKKLDETPDRRYIEEKMDSLQSEVRLLREQFGAIQENLELLLETNIRLREFLAQREKSKLKRLFKWL